MLKFAFLNSLALVSGFFDCFAVGPSFSAFALVLRLKSTRLNDSLLGSWQGSLFDRNLARLCDPLLVASSILSHEKLKDYIHKKHRDLEAA